MDKILLFQENTNITYQYENLLVENGVLKERIRNLEEKNEFLIQKVANIELESRKELEATRNKIDQIKKGIENSGVRMTKKNQESFGYLLSD